MVSQIAWLVLGMLFHVPAVVPECDTTHYHIMTTGISDNVPHPPSACKGVPFFPELETDRRKYFSVESGTKVAVYLATTSQIYDHYGQDYYQLELDVNGDVRLKKFGAAIAPLVAQAPAPFTLRNSEFVDLWVSVETDNTIHLGSRDGGEIVSWQDTNVIDVNYILVQNYDDNDRNNADWEMCDSTVKLLSQNQDTTKTVTTTKRTDDGGDTDENAINNDNNGGVYDPNECTELGDGTIETGFDQFAWWRLDLQDMYNVKAVTIVDSITASGTVCPKGWRRLNDNCYYLGLEHMNYDNARLDCFARGGHLVTIAAEATQLFIEDWLENRPNGDPVWIGLNDLDMDNTWNADMWIDGVTNFNIGTDYENFAGAQPDDSGDCVALIDNDEWDDIDCTTTGKYICQGALAATASTPTADLTDAEVRVGSCDHPIGDTNAEEISILKKNSVCETEIDNNEVDLDHRGFWLFRECNLDYYGQYVYITKETTSPDIAVFTLCEVEVWGIDISTADKPKVGFTVETVSDLEGNLGTQTMTVSLTDGSAAHPTCVSFSLAELTGLTNPATVTTDYTESATAQYNWCPGDATTWEHDIVFVDDNCVDETLMLGFQVVPVTTGVCAADDTGTITYETITYSIVNDDANYYWQSPTYEVYEDVGSITATLVKEGYMGLETTVDVITADGTATENVNYLPIETGTDAAQVTFPADTPTQEVTVTIQEDNLCPVPPSSKTFTIQMTDACTSPTVTDTTTVSILDDDVILSFLGGPYQLSETDGSIEIVVQRLGYRGEDVQVDVLSQPIVLTVSAMPEDWTPVAITALTIPANTDTASFTLHVTDDSLVEDYMEKFNLVLIRNPTSLPTCVIDGTDGVEDVTILDNDCNWSMMVEETSINEDDGTVPITILCERDDGMALDRAVTAIVTVASSAITDGTAATSATDFTSSTSKSVTIPQGQTMTTINVNIKDDFVEELVEYFDVTLTSTSDGVIGEPTATRVTINDDDATVQLTTCNVDGMLVQEGTGTLTVTLERTGDLTGSDSVLLFTNPLTASSGIEEGDGDYVGVLEEALYFGINEATISYDIIINDDNEYEKEETFVVQIKKHNVETTVEETLARCIVTIQDNDCAFSISSSIDDNTVEESVGEIEFTVTRWGFTEAQASVLFSTSTINSPQLSTDATSGLDYIAVSQTINFEPDPISATQTQTVKVQIVDDDDPEIDEYFAVSLSDMDCPVFRDPSINVRIEDDDRVEVSMADDSVTVNEDAGVAHVTLKRSGSVNRVDYVTLTLVPHIVTGTSTAATINGDFSAGPIIAEFLQGQQEIEVEIPIIDDDIEEDDLESFLVRISSVKQSLTGGFTPTDANVDDDNRETVVFIRDDDGAFILRSLGRYTESIGSIPITVERTGPTTEEQTIYISTRNVEAVAPEDYQSLVQFPLTFRAGSSSASVSLNIEDDKIPEGSEDLWVCWSLETDDPDAVDCTELVTIEDDDNEISFIRTPGTAGSDNEVIVEESIDTVRLQVQRSGYGGSLPAGSATVTIQTREIINPGLNEASAADQIDYTLRTTTLTFRDGQTRGEVILEIEDDQVGESQEVFEVELFQVSPDSNNVIVNPSVWRVYIIDDDGGVPGGDGPGGDGDGDGDADDNGLNSVSKSLIIGLGGGAGLLLLLSILGLMGCWLATRAGRASPPAYTARPAPRQVVNPRSISNVGPPQQFRQPPGYYNRGPIGYYA